MSDAPLWSPSEAARARAELTRFRARVRERLPEAGDLSSYAALHRWSVEHREAFWAEVWRFGEVIAEERPGREPWDEVLVGRDRMMPPTTDAGPRWFTGARLNFAENLLRRRDASRGHGGRS